MMAIQIVMDHTGDTRHHFDPADAVAVAEAEKRFTELTAAGFNSRQAARSGKERDMQSFDPFAEETLFIPRLKGG
jgi:hypothetical protein